MNATQKLTSYALSTLNQTSLSSNCLPCESCIFPSSDFADSMAPLDPPYEWFSQRNVAVASMMINFTLLIIRCFEFYYMLRAHSEMKSIRLEMNRIQRESSRIDRSVKELKRLHLAVSEIHIRLDEGMEILKERQRVFMEEMERNGNGLLQVDSPIEIMLLEWKDGDTLTELADEAMHTTKSMLIGKEQEFD